MSLGDGIFCFQRPARCGIPTIYAPDDTPFFDFDQASMSKYLGHFMIRRKLWMGIFYRKKEFSELD
jgi:hypothetical protein